MKTNKDLLSFLFGQMEKLDTGKIDVETAKSQANLAKQANNAMRYELDRAKVLMKLSEHNATTGENISLRDIDN